MSSVPSPWQLDVATGNQSIGDELLVLDGDSEIPAAVMILAMVFFCGSPLYRYKLPRGSPLTSVFQVVVAAAWKRSAKSDDESMMLYEGPTEGQRPVEMLAHTEQFRFLDKAAVPQSLKDGSGSSAANPWRLCTVTQVEVKMLLRLFPIWLSTIILWTALSQMETFSVEEGSTMDHSIGPLQVPPGVRLSSWLSMCS